MCQFAVEIVSESAKSHNSRIRTLLMRPVSHSMRVRSSIGGGKERFAHEELLPAIRLRSSREWSSLSLSNCEYESERCGSSQLNHCPCRLTTRNLSKELHDFLLLLVSFRPVILQDCALLQQKYDKHFLLKHRLFASKEFTRYARKVVWAEASARNEQHGTPSMGQATRWAVGVAGSLIRSHAPDEHSWIGQVTKSVVSLVKPKNWWS